MPPARRRRAPPPRRLAARLPDKPAIVGPKAAWSYAALDSITNQLAHGLYYRGILQQDVVAIWAGRDPALALAMWLQALAEHCGARLLRLKGLVAVGEQPGSPAIIHAVQHVVSSPDWLPQWPSADHATRIVIITEGVPRHFPTRLLDAIEEEVRETTTDRGA